MLSNTTRNVLICLILGVGFTGAFLTDMVVKNIDPTDIVETITPLGVAVAIAAMAAFVLAVYFATGTSSVSPAGPAAASAVAEPEEYVSPKNLAPESTPAVIDSPIDPIQTSAPVIAEATKTAVQTQTALPKKLDE